MHLQQLHSEGSTVAPPGGMSVAGGHPAMDKGLLGATVPSVTVGGELTVSISRGEEAMRRRIVGMARALESGNKVSVRVNGVELCGFGEQQGAVSLMPDQESISAWEL